VARKSFTEERLSIEEALKTYTVNGAYASFSEDKRGTIEVGKLADFTVLSDDLSTIASSEIRNLTVEMTIVNGEIVYSSNSVK
jgi:predicted amidohydrolase YtcJ